VEYFSQAVACIHPSHSEGMPSVILESMACGRPVIAAEVCGSIDLVDHNVNGLLVPPHQPRALADAVIKLSNELGLADRLGEEGRRKVREHYSWNTVVDSYINEYLVLCKQSEPSGKHH